MKTGIKWLILLVVCGFFLVAGLLKASDPAEFALSILRYRLVGEKLAWIAALWLPWLEMIAALALLWPRLRHAGIWLIFLLLLMFEVSLASAAWRGLDIDCGCLGSGTETSVEMALIRNLVLMGSLLVLVRLEKVPQ
ncbi:MAG TPA: MauE/DoxX family redox-associated membrane protein [Oceanipulchritudo sp.]|nr:MauE/DoxX family redox-associated membrane protein [Oceanipulchritudo sp.]